MIAGKRSICAVLGCGGGKSVIQGTIAASANAKGNRVLFIVHRRELCEQITNTFRLCGVDFGLTDICMVQTVTRHIEKLEQPVIIITDEAHHCLATTYRRIYDAFPDAVRLGFTATPCRMGSGGLGAVFDALVEGVSTKWLIDNHYLAPYHYYSFRLADTRGLHVRRGEYIASEVAELMEKPAIYGETVSSWRKVADGKKTIVYCASIKASQCTADEFNACGIAAAHLDGTTDSNTRAQTIADFRAGKIKVLCNVDLFGEGFDVPDCECVVLLRPTQSLTLYIQQSMRSMRYQDGKTAIIIDHVQNVHKHGLPDEAREWTLEEKKRKQTSTVMIKECPICFSVVPQSIAECPECKHEFAAAEREELQRLGGEIYEVTPEEILRRKPYKHYMKAKSFEELVAFQKARGYKFAWAIHKAMELHLAIPPKYDYMRRYIS